MTKNLPDHVRSGQRWIEEHTGKVVVILRAEVHGTGPSWRYEDEEESETNWHYSDLWEFAVWDEFRFLGES